MVPFPVRAIAALAPTLLAACQTPEPRRAFLHERIQRVMPDGQGGAEISFEYSARRYVIDPLRSPDPDAMLQFARAANASGRAVYATFDPGEEGPKRPDVGGGPVVLLRLADTPDPTARR